MNLTAPPSEVNARLPGIAAALNPIAIFIMATIFLYWDASRAVYILSALAATLLLLRYRPRIPREARLYTWPIFAYVGAALLSVLFNDMTDSGFNKLVSRFFLLLLAIPLAHLFYLAYDTRRNVWIMFVVGAVVMGALALVEYLVLDRQRADGGHNAATFGFIALATSAIVIASYYRLAQTRPGKILFYLALLMGFCAMLLSGTRTSWIAGGAVFVLAMFFYLHRYSLLKRGLFTLLLVGVIAIAGGSLPIVQKRLDHMAAIVTPYLSGEEQTEFNSLRNRVETWKAAWHIGMQNKLFGFGPGNTKTALEAYIRQQPQLHKLKKLTHIHNQFLQSFAMTGLVGLFSLLALVGCHFWLFARYLRSRYSREVRSLALAGLLLVVAYLIKSIPGVPFYGKHYLLMYGFASAVIWGSLLGALRASTQSAALPLRERETIS